MSRRPVSRWLKLAVAGVLAVTFVVVVAVLGTRHRPAHQWTRTSSALEVAEEAGLVAAVYADKVDSGELTQAQAETLTMLDERAGSYDEQSIVLQGVGEERAEELASRLGATLRITRDGSYARLTLPAGTSITDVLSQTELATYAEDVEPDWYVELAATDELEDEDAELGLSVTDLNQGSAVTFDDPYYSAQSYFDYLNAADVLGRTMDAAPLVAVIDTGIDYESPEFQGRISDLSYNATEDKVVSSHGWDVIADEQGHGTAVAGVLAAAANNGTGIVGVAPGAQLLVVKAACDKAGRFASVSDLVFGLYYAVEQGASVVNMSFGTYAPIDPFASAVKLAVDSDVALVAAAGNDATAAPCYPAANASVIGIGALGSGSYELAPYSNFGEYDVELVAPGSVVTLMAAGSGSVQATVSSGTSFSAPIVAGAVARYKAVHPHADNAEVVARLRASASDLGEPGRDWYFGYGALDLSAFVDGEAGIITFDMLTDEVEDETRTFIVGKALQDVPEPERENAMFDGWYHDDQLEDAYDHQSEKLYGAVGDDGLQHVTVYAAWTNEDDGQPFTYRAADGLDPANGIEVTGYAGKRRYMVVPETIDDYTVMGIAAGAFAGNATIVTASLPETLTYIGAQAFAGCTRLVSLDIPDAVTTISAEAFKGCARLQQASFGTASQLQTLGTEAFAGCPSLRALHLGPQVTGFDGSVVLGDTALASVTVDTANATFALADDGVSVVADSGTTLVYRPAGSAAAYETPAGVTTVGAYALAYSRAAAVTVSDGVTTLGEGALQAVSAATLGVPASLARLGDGCFMYASGISELDLSATQVTVIPPKAFMLCTALAGIQLPSGLTGIGPSAFAASGLGSLELPAGVTSIGGAAFQLTPLRTVVLSEALTTLGENIFSECYALTTVSFPDPCALAEIPAYAFANTPALDAIELPSSLVAVREHAFHTSGLTSVAIPASVTTIEQGAFADCPQLAHVSVAAGNATYSATDDVLFDAAATTLVLYPAGRAGDSYEVPASVRTITGYAFQGARKLREVSLPAGMTELSASAFSRCYSLERAVLPEGLTIINVNAFEYCTALSSINIPASVLTVARYAFYCDAALTDVAFAEGAQLARVGFAAFAYTGLADVTLPATVTTMGQYAFAGCTGLGSFALADGSALSGLPAYVFEGCERLASVGFGQGAALRALSARSLEGLPALESVDLSGCTSLTSVGNYALDRCFALSDVRLPASTQSIGRYAFFGCTSLATLNVPAAVSFIGRYAFTSCAPVTLYFEAATLPAELQDDWNYGIEGYYLGTAGSRAVGDWVVADAADGTVAAVRYTGSAAEVDATAIDGKAVSAIGYGCFRDNTTLAQVTLGEGLTTICDYAFAGTTALGSVNIPAGVTYVGDHAFDGSAVASVTFAEGSQLARIGDSAFANTASLAAIQIPASVTRIGRAAFKGSAVADVTLAEGSQLAYVGRQAFQESGITAIAFPDTIAEIDDYAFYNAKSLASLDLGNPTDLKIQTHAFYGTALASVRIPAGATYIGELAFDAITELTGIEVDADNPHYLDVDGVLYDDTKTALVSYPAGKGGEVVIPAHVTSIRFGAFEHAKVTSVRFEEGSRLTTIGYRAFYGCDSLESFEVPAGVTSIDRYAFAECDNLVTCDVSRATGLTGIYQGAFYNDAKLAGFALPDSVREVGDRAFYGCASMTTAVPATSSVRAIGDGAFAYSGVTELAAPADLLTIGKEAFKGSALRDLDLDNGVLVEIGTEAFADCADFATTELVIPDTVDYIGTAAFITDGASITAISLPVVRYADSSAEFTLKGILGGQIDALESVAITSGLNLTSKMFEGCGRLSSVSLPYGILAIPQNCFNSCGTLQDVKIPESVKTIGESAFNGTALTCFTAPLGLSEIGRFAFCNCHSLKQVILNDGLQYIGEGAFGWAPLEGELHIPETIACIDEYSFVGNKLDTFVVNKDNGRYSSVQGMLVDSLSSTLLAAPGGIKGSIVVPLEVVVIAERAFGYCEGLEEISFSDNLESIGIAAFQGCVNLRTVTVPDSVTTFGEAIFNGCTSLEAFAWPAGIPDIPSGFFADCKNLRQFTFPEGLLSIGESAFSNCISLEEVDFPASVEIIGTGSFAYCDSLQTVHLGSGVTSIGESAFGNCLQLEMITVDGDNDKYYADEHGVLYEKNERKTICAPCKLSGSYSVQEGTRVIGMGCFASSNISEIVLPDSVSTIRASAFMGCENLKSATLGSGIRTVETQAFMFTPLESADVAEDGAVYIDSCLIGYDGSRLRDRVEVREECVCIANQALSSAQMRQLILTDTVRSFGAFCCWGCSNLECVYLNEGLESIGVCAFLNSDKLESITIPSSVTDIGGSAFWGCTGLNSVTFLGINAANLANESKFAGQGLNELPVFENDVSIKKLIIGYSLDAPDTSIDIFKNRWSFGNNAVIEGITNVVILPSASESQSVRIKDISGAVIYCYENIDSTCWQEGWEGDNTVYYLGDWNMATFKVDGRTIASNPVKTGEVVEAPSATEVQAALADDCSFTFLGWDIDGDGNPDTLPTTLNAYGELTAEAIYTTHAWDEGTTVEPTCTEDGTLTHTCTTCGKTKVETIPALEHDFVAGEVVAPTENEDGYTVYTCSRCGETEHRDFVIATGAEPSDWTVTKPATCEETGEEAIFTPSGNVLETREIPALGHSWNEGAVTTEPTCTTEGMRTFTCAHDASHTYTEPIAALGHDWDEWETVTEATYEAAGLRRRTCKRCGEVEEQEIPQLEWVDAGGVSLSVSDTTLKPGDTLQLTAALVNPEASDPTVCWASSDESVATVDAFGLVTAVEDGVAWISATATDGTVDRCQVIVQHEHEAGEPFDEAGKEPTCEQPGWHSVVTPCSRCGAELSRERVEDPALGHSWDEGEITTAPTCEAEGMRTFTCANDPSHTKTEAIEPLGHSYVETIVAPTWDEGGYTLHRCERCGDEYRSDETAPLSEAAQPVVDPVIAAIANLPLPEALTLDDEPAVSAARASYDSLSDQEKTLVTNLATLEAAEARIGELRAAADKAEADQQAATTADTQIDALPAPEDLTLADATTVALARAAYDALTDEQKLLAEKLPALEEAEARIAELRAVAGKADADAAEASGASAAIAELPQLDNLTLDDATTVAMARARYDALTDDQKALVAPETLEALTSAEARIDNLTAARATAQLAQLPSADALTLADADAITTARAAYEALTEAQKALVDPAALAQLTATEEQLAQLQAQQAQREADIEAARPAAEAIAVLPALADLTTADADAVATARAAYDALTDEQKALVANYAALVEAEAQLDLLRKPSLASAEVTGIADATYTGEAVTQAPVVTLGDATLTEGTDYVIGGVTEATAAGSYELTLTGIGAYCGEKAVIWRISKAANPAKVAAATRQVLVKSAKKKAQTVAPLTLTQALAKPTYAKASTESKFKKWAVNASTGKVTLPKGTKKGTYNLKIKVSVPGDTNHEALTQTLTVKVQVVTKLDQPMVASAVQRTVQASKLAKKAQAVARPLLVSKAKGKLSYKKAKGSKAFAVNAKTGKVTVKKGTKAGTYTIKIKVTASGNGSYKKGSKTVTTTIVVR